MSSPGFRQFFTAATGKEAFAYQCRLACGDGVRPVQPATSGQGHECRSLLIDVPTGLGKTAAVVLAWLWNRVQIQDPKWPRRLVYCLPMRTLVEQTEANVREWLGKLDLTNTVGVHVLMGGEEAGEWDLHPERATILIGTQDMLLSRALNRGYGMSRYRWPMHFGLLNNDCLWVMDETQLMSVGVESSAQLDGFRNDGKMHTVGACLTWWMSATLDDARLDTVDHRKPQGGWPTLTLSEAERTGGRPKELITAAKKLSPAPLTLSSATKGDYARQLAQFIKDRHQPGTLTLVVVNRVQRAREIFQALTAAGKKGRQTIPPLCAPEKVALIHSRFRPKDRERHSALLFAKGDRIVIATQAVEAGVDVSARLLITELSPWSSLVQRMGRCNRYAEITEAEVLWVDLEPKDDKDELLLPYTKAELDKARAAIAPLADASPRTLRSVTVVEEKLIRPVIRHRDLVDLFDTTPDICGQDLDVSRYIRDGEDSDVQFFWRDLAEGKTPDGKQLPPARDELCRVSIGEAARFLRDDKRARAWRWNPLEKRWESTSKPRPGGVYLVATASGGYSDALGWTGESQDRPTPHPPASGDNEAYEAEPDTFSRAWQKLDEHTLCVIAAVDTLADALALDASEKAALHTAALWHDVGKAHDEFQSMLRNGDASRAAALWAKSADAGGKCSRRGFRHELASALAWLLAGPPGPPERDLVAYLIAAHHGKVRLSIRSLPDEPAPEPPTLPDGTERLFARGVWQGDTLPAAALGETTVPAVTLDLGFMRMGEGPRGPSWLARTVALRDRLGPFRLAFLETILRAADARASRTPIT